MRETTTIDLTKGYQAVVYLDTCEKLRLRNYEWSAQVHKRGYIYAVRNTIGITYLHRVIAGAKKGQTVDHINRDTLDCRDDNLRLCTNAQNQANSRGQKAAMSGLKGVTWSDTSRKWKASIRAKGILYYLGLFQDRRRAAIAHDCAALALHGKFAGLNYPDRAATRAIMPIRGYIVGARSKISDEDKAFS